MIQKSILVMSVAAVAIGSACTKSADIERRESGMTGSTTTTDQNDPNPQHAEKRKAVNESAQSGTTENSESTNR